MMKKFLKRFKFPICLFLAWLILYSSAMFSVFEIPWRFLWHQLPPSEFLGKFTYEELKGGNELYIENCRIDKDTIKLTPESVTQIDNILSGHTFKTALIDFSFTGSVCNPKTQICLSGNSFYNNKSSVVFTHHRGGIVSYGVNLMYLLKDRVLVVQEIAEEESVIDEDKYFVVIHPTKIAYYCKDPELVDALYEYVNSFT